PVHLRLLPSWLIVIAEESRSQHENRVRALKRMRQELYLKLREELPADKLNDTHGLEELRAARAADGRLHLGRKDARFWPAVGVALDVLQAVGARVSEAAAVLGISTGNLIDFLQTEPKVW